MKQRTHTHTKQTHAHTHTHSLTIDRQLHDGSQTIGSWKTKMKDQMVQLRIKLAQHNFDSPTRYAQHTLANEFNINPIDAIANTNIPPSEMMLK